MLEDVAKLLDLLEFGKFRYCLIGGMAMLAYGGRASTLDLDFYILASDLDRLKETLQAKGYPVRSAGPDQAKVRFGQVPVDILRADPWVGIPALKMARKKKFLGKMFSIARPEDVIIMKTISDRSVDRRDVEELKEIFAGKLDTKYIQARLRSIRRALAD